MAKKLVTQPFPVVGSYVVTLMLLFLFMVMRQRTMISPVCAQLSTLDPLCVLIQKLQAQQKNCSSLQIFHLPMKQCEITCPQNVVKIRENVFLYI